MLRDNPENRTDLHLYYKKVKICSRCKKEFGCDSLKNSNFCPACYKGKGEGWSIKKWHRKKDRKPMEYPAEESDE